MILAGKHILVFAASGAIAGEVARTFAKEGAHVWLSARNPQAVEALAAEIEAVGGKVNADVVDATDPTAVEEYVERVVSNVGQVHGVFNGIGGRPEDLGYPDFSTTQSLEHFMRPLNIILGSQFLTARTVGKYMIQQGHGVIVTLSATLSGTTAVYMTGISAACGAIEAMTRALAGEFGPHGIRVNCVRGSAMPETRTIQETIAGQMRLSDKAPMMGLPPLGRPITVAETATTAAFLASDLASGMTGQVVTVCGGAFVG